MSALPATPSRSHLSASARDFFIPGRCSSPGRSTCSCISFPLAVRTFSAQSPSRWINPHWRRQKLQCSIAEIETRRSSSSIGQRGPLHAHLQSDPFRKVLVVYLHNVVRERAWSFDAFLALDGDEVEEVRCTSIPKEGVVLENEKLPRAHQSARGRAIILEHLLQCFPKEGKVSFAETGLIGE